MIPIRTLWLAGLVALLGAVVSSGPGCGGGAAAGDAGVDAATPGDVGVDAGDDAPTRVALTIIHTTDEHGWLQPTVVSGWVVGGAANIRSWWTEREGYDPARDLLISSGDCWTGPAISTWFAGEPVVDAMNLMGYASQTLGNHEFDFGQDVLRVRAAQADYPFLGANVHVAATGELVDFAQPYTITTVNGVKVGVIGLTTPTTATAANPPLVADLDFQPLYDTTVALVPEARAAGAEVVVVAAHEVFPTVVQLAEAVPVRVDAFFAGHGHDVAATTVDGVPVVNSGFGWRSYSVVTLTYDRGAGAVVDAQVRQEDVAYPDGSPNPVTPDPALAALVDDWQGRADAELSEVLGYTAAGVGQATWAQASWIVDAWRWAYPDADLAILNAGGVRQAVPSGDVTLGTIVGMLPFDDNLYGVTLTGAQVTAEVGKAATCGAWGGCWPLVSGMTYTGMGATTQVTLAGGASIDPTASYRVLVTDFQYNGGGGAGFADYDPAPIDYGANYRQPVVDWTRQLGTSAADPLEAHLDPTPRAQ